jgi:hypothetical protein
MILDAAGLTEHGVSNIPLIFPHVPLRIRSDKDPSKRIAKLHLDTAKLEVEACLGCTIGCLDDPKCIRGQAVGLNATTEMVQDKNQ